MDCEISQRQTGWALQIGLDPQPNRPNRQNQHRSIVQKIMGHNIFQYLNHTDCNRMYWGIRMLFIIHIQHAMHGSCRRPTMCHVACYTFSVCDGVGHVGRTSTFYLFLVIDLRNKSRKKISSMAMDGRQYDLSSARSHKISWLDAIILLFFCVRSENRQNYNSIGNSRAFSLSNDWVRSRRLLDCCVKEKSFSSRQRILSK